MEYTSFLMILKISLIHLVLQCNIPGIIMAFSLIVFMLTARTMQSRTLIKFLLLTLSAIFLVFSDILEYTLNLCKKPTVWEYIATATGYSVRVAIPLLLATIIYGKKSKILKLMSVPLFINSFLAYISVHTHWMFYYTDQNIFHGGPLKLTPFIVGFFYIVVLLYLSVRHLVYNICESVINFSVLACNVFSLLLEVFYGYKFILPATIIVSITIYFLQYNINMYKQDALTGLLNRRCFYLALNRIKNERIIIVSMDLNDLKKINDTYGHAAGDVAIKFTVDSMRKAFRKCGILYRTGGDEFILLCKNKDKYTVEKAVGTLRALMKDSGYKVACGLQEYLPGTNIEEAISLADAEMYKNKALLKAQSKIDA